MDSKSTSLENTSLKERILLLLDEEGLTVDMLSEKLRRAILSEEDEYTGQPIAEGLVTVSQAAKLLGLSEYRIAELCRQGRLLGAKKLGYSWVIPKNSALAYRFQRRVRKHRRQKSTAV